MPKVKVKDHKLPKQGATYCMTLDHRRIHMRYHVVYHQMTLCRRVVATDGIIGSFDKLMCEKCLRKAGQ